VVIGGAEPLEGSIEEPLAVLAELKNRELIRHLGVSNVTPNQLIEAQKITNIVCVQNFYNVANRNDDDFIDQLAKQGIPCVPFFPLGGLRRYNRRTRRGSSVSPGHAHADCAGVASSAIIQHSADPGHVFRRTPS